MKGDNSRAGTASIVRILDFTPGILWVRIAQSLAVCVVFVDYCIPFDHCIVCSFLILQILVSPLVS